MTISITEVIEEAAQLAEGWDSGAPIAKDIRALAAQYEGCIVADRATGMLLRDDDNRCALMYRAKQPETCKPALQVEEVEQVAHRHRWFRTGAMEPGQMRCIECGEWGRRIPAPARRPLTDDEIDRVIDVNWSINNHKLTYVAHRAFARAIERAHKIGGNDD